MYAHGLSGSKHSTLRNKIVPLPDFVQEAMDRSMGRLAIPKKKESPKRPYNQFDLCGGEAKLREEAAARALESKLNGNDDETPETTKKYKTSKLAPQVKLSVSISADGLARCFAGDSPAKKSLQSLEAVCKSIHAKPVSPKILNALATKENNSSTAHKKSKKTAALVQNVAKKSWAKLRSVVKAGFGMAVEAANTKAVEKAMSSTTGKGALAALDSIADVKSKEEKIENKHKLRRVITPRMLDGRIVPPWQPPPNHNLPLLKVKPRDVALLRVCKIPRSWAEQWLSGHDIDSKYSPTCSKYSPTSSKQSTGSRGSGGNDGSGKVKKSAISFDDARIVLPHCHTFLFHGRFVTTILDRSRLLAMLRDHPIGPTPETLNEVVKILKSERPRDGGPSGATYDRRIADNVVYEQRGTAIISKSDTFAGGHTHALEVEVEQSCGPGPGHTILKDGFASLHGTYKQAPKFNTSNHYSKASLTMLQKKVSNYREYENIGPGSGAYDTRSDMNSSLYRPIGGCLGSANDRFKDVSFKTPAAHDYNIYRGEPFISTITVPHGGVIAGKDKSELDRIILRSALVPGANAYKPVLPRNVKTPKFSTTFAPSELDLIIKRAKESPGPGLYYGSTDGVPSNDAIADGGNALKFTAGNYPSDLDLTIHRASKIPGPSAYATQNFFKQSQYHSNPSIQKLKLPFNVETMEESELRRIGKLPGPPRYADAHMKGASDRLGGGKFSTAYPLSNLERNILLASRLPGPADYQNGVNKKEEFKPGPYGSGLGKSKRTSGPIISKSKIPNMTEQAIIDGSRKPFWVHKQGDDKKIRKRIGGSVGKISDANPLTEFDLIVNRSKSTPGPLDYDLNSGMADEMLSRNNGKISTAFVKSDLEKTIDRSRKVPGPSSYFVKDIKKRATGPKFSTSIEPRNVEQIMRDAAMLPGPVDYQPIT
jgi:hypothetical protein